jgi:hypothetical protein
MSASLFNGSPCRGNLAEKETNLPLPIGNPTNALSVSLLETLSEILTGIYLTSLLRQFILRPIIFRFARREMVLTIILRERTSFSFGGSGDERINFVSGENDTV